MCQVIMSRMTLARFLVARVVRDLDTLSIFWCMRVCVAREWISPIFNQCMEVHEVSYMDDFDGDE